MNNLLQAVELYLRDTGIKPSRFGRHVLGDPRAVYDLRAGRTPRPKTEQALRAAITGLQIDRTTKPSFWTGELDHKLWSLVAQGVGRTAIAADLGANVRNVRARIHYLAEQRLPFRPHNMPLKDAIAQGSEA